MAEPQAIELKDDSMSMHEVDPLPVAEGSTDAAETQIPSESSPYSSKASSTASTLGLRDHTVLWWLNRIQRYSSYTFTVFAAAHITNTAVIPLLTQSVPTADTYLLLTRPYYQSALTEPLVVLAPLVLHIGSGLAARLVRRQQMLERYGAETRKDRKTLAWPPISAVSASGAALSVLVAGHALANRIVPLVYEGGSSGVGLQYVAHALAKHPVVAYSGYAVLVAVASYHVVRGWAKWLGVDAGDALASRATVYSRERRRQWFMVNGLAAIVAVIWLAGGTGVVGMAGPSKGWLGKQHDDLFHKIPLVGRWM